MLAVFLTLGAVRGDAERGLLQPLVVRPLGRTSMLLGPLRGRRVGVRRLRARRLRRDDADRPPASGRWPDAVVGPGLALVGGSAVIVALALLGSVFLSATANGIVTFMLFGAGLVGGLMQSIADGIGSHSLGQIAHGSRSRCRSRRSTRPACTR